MICSKCDSTNVYSNGYNKLKNKKNFYCNDCGKYSGYTLDDLKIFAIGAFIAGIIFPFTNWKETHYMIMFILYFSILKVDMLKKVKKIFVGYYNC